MQETHRRYQRVSQTVGAPAGDSQTVCDGAKTVWAPSGGSKTVFFDGVRDCLALLHTNWESPEIAQTVMARRRMYGSLLHVPRWSGRLSSTIADSLGVSCRCHSGLRDCLETSQTVMGSAACALPV
ncbi:hypothetical protein DPMN_192375 [Dreissena polymorpha]|uniref:Uncharacterized protein n=1 Tax=Dreissena polymorpha TaxID=45954 RepID=A0A9D3Y3L6_DREPO|nr:hypothetical protein DPMN_192375 [Dreissena polymorpha]